MHNRHVGTKNSNLHFKKLILRHIWEKENMGEVLTFSAASEEIIAPKMLITFEPESKLITSITKIIS